MAFTVLSLGLPLLTAWLLLRRHSGAVRLLGWLAAAMALVHAGLLLTDGLCEGGGFKDPFHDCPAAWPDALANALAPLFFVNMLAGLWIIPGLFLTGLAALYLERRDRG